MNKPHDPTFTIDAVISSPEGERFAIEPDNTIIFRRVLEDEQPFHWDGYKEGRAPEALRHLKLDALQNEYSRCLDMPVRLAGEQEYSVPEEWSGLLPLIKQLAATEHAHNPNWVEYNTYITIDCKEVDAGEQQRHGGLHVDGFQGERISPKHKITRNYVMTTNGGTRFYPQPFIVVDETKFNVFQGFDLQAGEPTTAYENCAYFMDAYCVHESGIAMKPGLRTFLRMTYDVKIFDRLGNTHNSMLQYDWDMVSRTVHEEVATPTLLDIQNSPYR